MKHHSKTSRRDFLKKSITFGVTSAIAGSAVLQQIGCVAYPFDIIIKNGMVVNGTGKEPFFADVGIRGNKILEIGNLSSAAAGQIIDAQGLIVSPGFIDIHSHLDMTLIRGPRAESKIRQGVTTTVIGNCGTAAAPLGGVNLDEQLRDFEKSYGFPCPYRSMDEYLIFLEQCRPALNVVPLLGLGDIREIVVGMDNRPATSDEMKNMKREVLTSMEAGCFGVSTGLEYTPGSFASTEELAELIAAVPEHQRLYTTHLRNEGDTLLEALTEAVTIAQKSGARLQISHLKAQNRSNWFKNEKAVALLENAIQSGIETHADRYPYIAYNTGLSSLFPLWCRDGGRDRFLSRLADKNELVKIREDVLKKVEGLGSWSTVLISSVHEEKNKKYQGKTISEITNGNSADPFEFVIELMLEEKGGVDMVGFGMDEPGTELILGWRNTMIASDASSGSPWGIRSNSRPHPRTYGTFPRAIGYYQRQRKITTLPEMVRKMTSLPAEKLGLRDRGTLAAGNKADLVIFDYEKIIDNSTFADPHQFPTGIHSVYVNGFAAVANYEQTGLVPGRVLRRQ